MKKYITFKIDKKEYDFSLNYPNSSPFCKELENDIANSENTFIGDRIQELAESGISVYTYDLYKSNTPEFVEYINCSILEYGLPNGNSNVYNKILEQSQFFYHQEQIRNNFSKIVFNSIIENLKNEVILIECQDFEFAEFVEEKIFDFINEFSENYELNEDSMTSNILNDFNLQFDCKLEELIYDKNTFKKKSDNSDDEDFFYIGLKYAVGKTPMVIAIPVEDSLKYLQNVVDGYIEVTEILNPYDKNKCYSLIVNEEGKLRNDIVYNFDLKFKYYNGIYEDNRVADSIFGNAVLLGQTPEGDWSSLSNEELSFWKTQLSAETEQSLGSIFLNSNEHSFELKNAIDCVNRNSKSKNNEFEL